MTQPPRCVAVIEDDPDQRSLIRHSLELRGYRVIEFESVERALGWELGNPSDPPPSLDQADLILLDINLPGLSGIESIQLLRESPQVLATPIAMMTGVRDSETVLKCIRAGAMEYFVKPLQIPEVMTRIDRILSDPTGLMGRAANAQVSWPLKEYLVREIKQAERVGRPLSIVIGGFRRTGDAEPLSEVKAERIWNDLSASPTDLTRQLELFIQSAQEVYREYDVLVPIGSQDFMVVLSGADAHAAVNCIHRLKRVFRDQSNWPELERRERWTLFLGAATFPEDGRDRGSLVEAAEARVSEELPPVPRVSQRSHTTSRTARCGACGHHFTYPKLLDRRFTPKSQDSDLRWIFEDIDPLWYAVMTCTECGFSGLESDWGELCRLAPPRFGWGWEKRTPEEPFRHTTQTVIPEELWTVLSPPFEAWIEPGWSMTAIPADFLQTVSNKEGFLKRAKIGEGSEIRIENALARYLLTRETYKLAGASPLRRAKIAHRIAWLFRAGNDEARERDALQEALDWYLTAFHFEDLTGAKPSDLEIFYLIGELYLRLDRRSEAVTIFDRLTRDPRTEGHESFLRMVRRRWTEARYQSR